MANCRLELSNSTLEPPSETPKVEVKRLADLTPDRLNANKGTSRGRYMLEKSLTELGAGRSVLLDRHGNIIAGNQTVEVSGEEGFEEVIVIKTNGRQLVAVQREDLDLYDENDLRARKLAFADNRVGEANLSWDGEKILDGATRGLLGDYWREPELEKLGKLASLSFSGGGLDLDTTAGSEAASTPLVDSHVRMVQLFYDGTTHPEFLRLVEALAPHFGTSNPTDTVLAVLRHAHTALD